MRARISWTSIVLALLGLQAMITTVAAKSTKLRTNPCTTITDGSISAMLYEINLARSELPAAGMPLVTWNATVSDALSECRASIGGDWFYTQNNHSIKTGINHAQFWGDYLIANVPPPGLPKICDFSHFAKDGWAYLWRDTNQCTATGQGSLQFNFELRMIKQKPCFDLAACDTAAFNDFTSCSATAVAPIPGKPCSWFWQYYIHGVMDHLYEIAVVRTGVNSPVAIAAGKHHTDSYFAYGRYLPGVLPMPSNDVPFVAGDPGSNCPKGFTAKSVQLGSRKPIMCVST